MKRLSIMAVTGVMTFVLSACGEEAPKPLEAKPDAMMPAQPAQAQPDQQGMAQPSAEQMSGATAQE